MHRWARRGCLAVGLAGGALLLSACEPTNANITVNTAVDGSDAAPGDGVCEMTTGVGDCSLRAAIDESNATAAVELVTIGAGIDPVLTLGAAAEDGNATGDLDATDGFTLDGAGATIDAAGLDRAFELHGAVDVTTWFTLKNVTVIGGDVAGDGGGVRADGKASVAFDHATLASNHASGDGGALFIATNASASLTDSTVSGNGADGRGGGIWSSGGLTLRHATVTANDSGSGGAVQRDGAATGVALAFSSIIGMQASGSDCAGTTGSGGYNVASDGSCGFAAAGDQVSVDPLLGPLQDNGGVSATHLPYVDSPAIDSEVCVAPVAEDQRGVARPQHGACDSGATEVKYEPVPMGGGRNALGVGDDPLDILPSALTENMSLAVSGPCASAEQGDVISAQTDANYAFQPAPSDQNPGPMTGGTFYNRCSGSDAEGTTVANPTYDPTGYFYAIEVSPSAAGQNLYIDVYDASMCSGSHAGDGTNSAGANFVTTYTVRGADASPEQPSNNPVLKTQPITAQDTNFCGTSGTDWQDKWVRLHTITLANPGTYFVQVQTSGGTADPTVQHGSNQFGLRAAYAAVWNRDTTPCSRQLTDVGIYNPDCPAIAAVGWMGVFGTLSGGFPSFFVGTPDQLPDRGRLVVEVWDAGEGTSGLDLLDPAARAVEFDWSVLDRSGADVPPIGGPSGTVTQPGGVPCVGVPPACADLDMIGQPNTTFSPGSSGYVRGWNPQPGPYRGSRSKYSDRLLQLTADLADDVASEYGLDTRFRLRYHSTLGGLTDRSAWRAFIWETGEAP